MYSGEDIAAVLLRCALGATMLAHGWNHAFGQGGLSGTVGWFESIGIRPGRWHARVATLTELGAGVLLVVGFLVPVAAGAVIGTMTVALVSNHLKNGFFIFRPGEGYEYVLNLIFVAAAIGALGAGYLSLDSLLGSSQTGIFGLAIAALLGLGGAALYLALFWRPSYAPRGALNKSADRGGE